MAKLQPSGERPRAARPRRLDWALRGMGDALIAALQRDRSVGADHLRNAEIGDQAARIARLIMDQADPTSNKRFTAWLVREYAEGRLILEDLGTANETLSLFLRYAPRLKPEQRDIQRYASLSAAWEAVRGFSERDEVHSNKAQKALDRAKAYEESRILRQDPDGFTVAVPLTEFAAKWWGKGTRWCTAAEKNNRFWQYHTEAPLITLMVPGLGKFQLWVTDREFQFMDAEDKPVSSGDMETKWNSLRPIFLAVLALYGHILKRIPLRFRTREICLSAVKKRGGELYHVPEKYKTHEVCLAAVQQYGWSLCWVPKKSRTAELCLAAVKQDGRSLCWVPFEHQSAEICLIAVQEDGRALEWVPREHRTYDLCGAAVRQCGAALQWVPEELRTAHLCHVAVKHDAQALEWVPEDHRSREICLVAVQQNGLALQLISEKRRDSEVCLAAVQQAGAALRFVPELQRNHALYLAAVQQDGEVLKEIPWDNWSSSMCRAAVRSKGIILRDLPDGILNKELCDIATQQDGLALGWVPSDWIDLDMCRNAVRSNGRALEFVPWECRTIEVCILAIRQRIELIEKERRFSGVFVQAPRWADINDDPIIRYVPDCLKDGISSLWSEFATQPTWPFSILDRWDSAFREDPRPKRESVYDWLRSATRNAFQQARLLTTSRPRGTPD